MNPKLKAGISVGLVALVLSLGFFPLRVRSENIPIDPTLAKALLALARFKGSLEVSNITFTWDLNVTSELGDVHQGRIHFDYLKILSDAGGILGPENATLNIDYSATARGLVLDTPALKLDLKDYQLESQITFFVSNSSVTIQSYASFYDLVHHVLA